VYRGASHIRKRQPPRASIGPYAYAYCRVLGGDVSYERGTHVGVRGGNRFEVISLVEPQRAEVPLFRSCGLGVQVSGLGLSGA